MSKPELESAAARTAAAPHAEPERRFARRLAADVQALRATTAAVPGLDCTASALRRALADAVHPAARPVAEGRARNQEAKGGFMKTLYAGPGRTRMFTAVLTGGLLLGALLWPVSYERTIGHTITLTVQPPPGGAPLTPQAAAGLAERLKRAVGAGAVRVTASDPAAPLVLTARVPVRARKDLEPQVTALTAALQAEHLGVTPSIVARTEHHRGRVYAMALDKLIDIRIDTAGKTDTQVETELRDQLTRSGMTPDSVQFQRTSDESQAEIKAHDGERELHIVRRQKGGPSELHIQAGGLDTERTPGMTDEQLRDKIAAQLAARGLTATVTVSGDQVQIRAEKAVAAP
jgi:hypothetical protein